MAENHTVYEGDNVHEHVQSNPDIKIGHTVTYEPNNQLGWKKYKVVKDDSTENGKGLDLIQSNDDGDLLDSDMNGGRRRRKSRRKKSRRKTRRHTKSRRKTHRRRR
jgi:hypothetical protein